MIPQNLQWVPPAQPDKAEPDMAKKLLINSIASAVGYGAPYVIEPPAPVPAATLAVTPPDPAPAPPSQAAILAELAEVREKLGVLKRTSGYKEPASAAAQSAADQRKAALDAAIKAKGERREAKERAKIARQGRKLGLLP